MIQLNAAVGGGDGGADGIAAGINRRRVGIIQRDIITPIRPAVFQRIIIDGQVLRQGHGRRGQRESQDKFG